MPPSVRNSRSAFTLVEMLVSIAVLVLIMTFIAQMMNSVSLSTTLSDKHIDTDNEARLVFDRMAMDFASMPLRSDIDYIFSKQNMGTSGGSDTDLNDKMFFYSAAPAFYTGSTAPDPKCSLALIGYCINSTGSNNTGATVPPPYYCLQRLSKGLVWDSQYPAESQNPGGIMSLTFNPYTYTNTKGTQTMSPGLASTLSGNSSTGPALGAEPDYSGTDSNFDMLANQVFRMEFCFQVKDLAPNSNGGTVFSNYPVAVFADSNSKANASSNIRTLSSQDPIVTGAQGSIGDRWYNLKDNRAYELTGFTFAPNTTQISNPPPTAPPALGAVSSTIWTPIGLSDVTAIVVTIAVMDSNSRKVLSQEQLSAAASALPKFQPTENTDSNLVLSGTTDLMATAWQKNLDGQGVPPEPFYQLTDEKVPQAAASQIRVYQRFFYLNNN
jgi:prepilin-type N-terminal cleavage/methylation domain-containing protein